MGFVASNDQITACKTSQLKQKEKLLQSEFTLVDRLSVAGSFRFHGAVLTEV